jgi:hypothetical protein
MADQDDRIFVRCSEDNPGCGSLALCLPCYPACDSRQVTKATTRPVAVLAALSFLLTACGGGPAHNGVASLGNDKTTTTQSSAAAGSSSGEPGGPSSGSKPAVT